jgi:transcriptional regulator GlxA family with amidase domain
MTVSRQVAIILFDDFPLLEVGSIAEVFDLANRFHSPQVNPGEHYIVRLLSSRGGAVASTSGMRVWTDGLDARYFRGLDALFVAGGAGAFEASRDQRLLAWLRNVAQRTQLVWSLDAACSILSAAGLLAGSQHLNGPASVETFSTTAVMPSRPYGLSSAYDPLSVALSLVRRDLSYETARKVAGCLTPRYATGLDEWSGESVGGVSELVRAAAHRLDVNCERSMSISDAAHAAGMSERNFLRRFKLEMGVTPSEYLLRARLEKACYLLLHTDLPVDKIARRTGLGSGVRLAKLFRQRLSTSPTEYRSSARDHRRSHGQRSDEVVGARLSPIQ